MIMELPENVTTWKAAEKNNQNTPENTRIYAKIIKNMLVRLHPKLPAYFCNSGYRMAALPISENVQEFLERNNAIMIDPEGHVDNAVLVAIHKLIDRKRGNTSSELYCPPSLGIAMEKELKNPNSELSRALAKAYKNE